MAKKRKKAKRTTAKRKSSSRKTVRRKATTRKKATTRRKKATTRRKKTTTRRKKTTTKRKAKTKRKGAKRKTGISTMSCSLSSDLAAICGGKSMTRPQVMKKVWNYIKSHKCQDSKNRRMINPDAKLAKVTGARSIDMLKLAGCISKHIAK